MTWSINWGLFIEIVLFYIVAVAIILTFVGSNNEEEKE